MPPMISLVGQDNTTPVEDIGMCMLAFSPKFWLERHSFTCGAKTEFFKHSSYRVCTKFGASILGLTRVRYKYIFSTLCPSEE